MPAVGRAGYQDRIIAAPSGAEAEDPLDDDPGYDTKGWARYARIEARAGTSPFQDGKVESGGAFSGFLETPNYGVVSAEVNLSNPSRWAGTLRQRGMPMEGGWLASHDFGVTGTPLPAIMRLPSRAYVPGNLIQGLAADWQNAGQGLQLQLASGRPGWREGYPVDWFRPAKGSIDYLGAQSELGSWQVASRLARGRGISTAGYGGPGETPFGAEAVQLSLRRNGEAHGLQANLMQTRTSTEATSRYGFWLDDEWRSGSFSNALGMYRFEPNLSWVGQMLAYDIEGAYARTAFANRRWTANGSIDLLRPVSKPAELGMFVAGNARWRYSKDISLGGGGYFRKFDGQAWSAYLDARWQNDFGNSGARLAVAHDLSDVRREQLTLDHSWPLATDAYLSTSISAEKESANATARNRWSGALSFGLPLGHDASLRTNLVANRVGGEEAGNGANISLNWKLSRAWSLDLVYSESRNRHSFVAGADPLSLPVVSATVVDRRMAFLALRYEEGAGRSSVPLGGNHADGGGGIEGTVFLDANRNGAQEASEAGASGVTILLDGRYATRTDIQGRFHFPFVVPGPHKLTISNETLPLPWLAADDGRIQTEVRVRDLTKVQVGAVRQGNP